MKLLELIKLDRRTSEDKALDDYERKLAHVLKFPADDDARAGLARAAVAAGISFVQMGDDLQARERLSEDERDAEAVDAALFGRLVSTLSTAVGVVRKAHQREGFALRRRQQRVEAELMSLRRIIHAGPPLRSNVAPSVDGVGRGRELVDAARREKEPAIAALQAARAVYEAQAGRAAGASGGEAVIADALKILRKWDMRAWLTDLAERDADVRDVAARAFVLQHVRE